MIRKQKKDTFEVVLDNVLVDMNGIIHNAAQKVFEYGKFKPTPRLLGRPTKKVTKSQHDLEIEVYQAVCEMLNEWVNITKPTKRLILCIDGPAPMSKQNQQRQRRFRAAMEMTEGSKFDSCSITPGTRFLHNLGKYIDWYIRTQASFLKSWSDIEVVFSSAGVAGEGEHKVLNILRQIKNDNETFCIIGNDADLIMLALAATIPKIYVLREDMFEQNILWYVDINTLSTALCKEMSWVSETFDLIPEQVKYDFIFLCFFVGNDFLPHVPTIEIIQDGIELIFDVYKEVCTVHGHITYQANSKTLFDKNALCAFLGLIGSYEKELLEKKLNKKESFFPDELVLDASKQNDEGVWVSDVEKYVAIYCQAKFGETSMTHVTNEYLQGMQWVLTYYTTGVPHWKWFYPYHYAPPASVMAKNMSEYKHKKYGPSSPSLPFEQLLRVLPPKSAGLLPEPLATLLTDSKSPLIKYCPEKFEIDLAGKRKEWEGTVIICNMDEKDMLREYNSRVKLLNKGDLLRNTHENSVVYRRIADAYTYKSMYGDIKGCLVDVEPYDHS